jgi:hypothetical protein
LKKNKKKIIFFCPQISDGGIEKTLINYLNYFSINNEISLVTNTFNTKQLKLISKRVEIINFKISYLVKLRILNNFICSLFLIKAAKKDTIIFSLQDHFFLLLFKFFGLKKKLVIRTPTAISNNKNKYEASFLDKKHFFKKFIIRFYKYSNMVITFSEDNKNYLKNHLNVKNVKVIYNFFPKHYGNKKIKKIYNIFFIGRLVDDKNPIFFLKNLIDINSFTKFKIHIVGKGNCLNEMKKISKKSNKDIKFHGYLKDPLIKLHKIIDLICVTSKYDGTPNILGEALAYKIPCLAPSKVGLSNLLFKNGKYGYLYNPGNNQSFKKQVIGIFKNYNYAINKAKKGFNSLDRFNKKNTLTKLENILHKI